MSTIRGKKTVFQKVFEEAAKKGYSEKDVKRAAAWFRATSAKLGSRVTPAELMKEDARLSGRIEYGKMYHFWYSAKWKDVLPYWDRFPLIFPIDKRKGGFLGINLHYLPPAYRAKLMDALFNLSNNKNYDKSTKLRISYDILNSASRYKLFKPCVKHYLFSHIQSPFLRITAAEWNIAVMLPTQKFVKAKSATVWVDSLVRANLR